VQPLFQPRRPKYRRGDGKSTEKSLFYNSVNGADLKKKNAAGHLYIDVTYVYSVVEDIFPFQFQE
jgi:hypothetical protein